MSLDIPKSFTYTGRSILDFLVFSNLFIAVCALLMTHQTYYFLLHSKFNYDLAGFIFFSTICSYSFHWYLTESSLLPSPRIEWLHRYRFIHGFLFFIGLAGAVIFFFALSPYWFWLLVAAIATFLYSAPKIPLPAFRFLRKLALGKTIFLAFVWTYVTTILPIILAGSQWQPAYILFVCGRFFMIYAICILFDYRDRQDDKAAGIRSLITFLNERGIGILFYSSLTVFVICSLLLLQYDYGWTDIILLILPGFVTAGLYDYARRHLSDLFYYLVLDGLMAVSAILMLIARI